MTQPNTNAVPMTKPFSTNPKLSDWVPTPEQIQSIDEMKNLNVKVLTYEMLVIPSGKRKR